VQPIVAAGPAAKVTLAQGSNGKVAMLYVKGNQRWRMGLAAVAGLVAGPAFAFGAMGFGGGFAGGFHGGLHGVSRRGVGSVPPPPAIDTPTPRPPFTNPPPPMRMHDRDHDHFVHNRFHDRFHNGIGGWGWGGWGWGGGDGGYQTAEAEPAYVAEQPPRAAEPPPCPELLTWSPKLGRATRQRLCDND
jgi:hypothetical protein